MILSGISDIWIIRDGIPGTMVTVPFTGQPEWFIRPGSLTIIITVQGMPGTTGCIRIPGDTDIIPATIPTAGLV